LSTSYQDSKPKKLSDDAIVVSPAFSCAEADENRRPFEAQGEQDAAATSATRHLRRRTRGEIDAVTEGNQKRLQTVAL
jgi:hypothetical protein